jgi:hypothetical protein
MGNHAAASLVAKGLVGAAVMAAATAGTLHLARGPAEPLKPRRQARAEHNIRRATEQDTQQHL